ncbi:hypothetical protein E4U43_001049 [Claviceps pusilla]|uniref:Uncharacterized protein n=1 Tax=Claviceps pusilla TaxID=123648 RepID=A0A9P7N8D4_9HYPO|nr:hypothetical protein E4U43_001049 [Claviceps pusilla]
MEYGYVGWKQRDLIAVLIIDDLDVSITMRQRRRARREMRSGPGGLNQWLSQPQRETGDTMVATNSYMRDKDVGE